MGDENTKLLCPRLVDFIVFVGRKANTRLQSHHHNRSHHHHPRQPQGHPNTDTVVGNELGSAGEKSGGHRHPHTIVSSPALLRRYPRDDHRDFELPTDVTYFCQPEGCVSHMGSGHSNKTAGGHSQWASLVEDPPTSFVFTLTEKDSAKVRYGISLNFFLQLELSPSTTPNSTTTSNATRPTQQSLSANPGRKKSSSARTENCVSLTSLCLMSHHPFLTGFRQLLITLRQLIDACNRRCNQDGALPKNALWSVLLGHWHGGAPIPSAVMDEVRELERWILSVLSAPVPVPGMTVVGVEVSWDS